MEDLEKIKLIRRRPKISIIITSNNNPDLLMKCIDSFAFTKDTTKNIEFVVINNYSDDIKKMQNIEYTINKYSEIKITYYQANYYINLAQSKNLGLNKAKGSWLFFIDHTEIATKTFVKFLSSFKFDLQQSFYRLPILKEPTKKQRALFLNNKFYSNLSSSLIINEEFIEKLKLRWDSTLETNDTLLFLNEIYSVKNVNYIYLKKMYSVIHNYYYDLQNPQLNNFENVIEAYNALIRQKKLNYKQFIIILFYNYTKLINKSEKTRELFYKIKKLLRDEKIYFWNYYFLGLQFFFKTFSLRWRTMF